jgi:hypothetical protein
MGQRTSLTDPDRLDVKEILTCASDYVRSAPDRKPWSHGWGLEQYRRSASAAISTNSGPMAIELPGVELYELAFTKLWKLPAIRSRWDQRDLWPLLADGIAHIAHSDNREEEAELIVQRLTRAVPSLVAFSIANVTWPGPPIGFSFGVIRALGDEFIAEVNSTAKRRIKMKGAMIEKWIRWQGGQSYQPGESNQAFDSPSSAREGIETVATEGAESVPEPCGASPGTSDPPPPVIWANWVPGQLNLAFRQAQREFENLLGVTLLLEKDPDAHGISMVTDVANRPGIRGITLDRRAVESLVGSAGGLELVTTPLIRSDLTWSTSHYWQSAQPLPLGDLLAQTVLRGHVEECLGVKNPVTDRIKVAARWYSEALWATQKDDAALALGVALDSLVGSRSGLPGREMRERFAFLEPDTVLRPERSARYQELFSVRSSIAHGSSSTRLEGSGFVNLMASDVTWAAHRLLALNRAFDPTSERALDDVFDGLRWGTLRWP